MVKILLTTLIVFGLTVTGWCSPFKDNGNGTVIDLATGLTWQQQGGNTKRGWTEAVSYCQELSLGGKTDWRLPDIKELQSIVDYRIVSPAIDTRIFFGTLGYSWSATITASDSGKAWSVYFTPGEIISFIKSNFFYVRCVR